MIEKLILTCTALVRLSTLPTLHCTKQEGGPPKMLPRLLGFRPRTWMPAWGRLKIFNWTYVISIT